jgi:hypothetical protein
VSNGNASRTQDEAFQSVQTHRLGASSEHERWRKILDAAKANHMDSVILRKCIEFALLSPDISAEDVLAHVMKDADSSVDPSRHERVDMVPLFEKAS